MENENKKYWFFGSKLSRVGLTIISLLILATLYLLFNHKVYLKTTPNALVAEDIKKSNQNQSINTQNKISQQESNSAIKSDIPVGWKIFSANGLSIMAPSDFKTKSDTALGVATVLIISSPKIIGEIDIFKFPNKASYDEQFSESKLNSMVNSGDIKLVNSSYAINSFLGKEYRTKVLDETNFTTSFILFPENLIAISVIPDENSFAGYTSDEVKKMIKSIKF